MVAFQMLKDVKKNMETIQKRIMNSVQNMFLLYLKIA